MAFTDGGPYAIIGGFHSTGSNTGVCSNAPSICGVYSPSITPGATTVFTFPDYFTGPYPAKTSFNTGIQAQQSPAKVTPLDTGCLKDGELSAIIDFS